MDDEILYQAPGITIAKTATPGTLVPYPKVVRPDGTNHGWVDTRGRPDLVDQIPEAEKSKGLREILLAVAHQSTLLMSSECECGAFQRETGTRPLWHVGGFVMLMYPEADRSADWKQLEALAVEIMRGIEAQPDHFITYELIIEPLAVCFRPPAPGRTGDRATDAKSCARAATTAT